MEKDSTKFPAPSYQKTVLEPIFEDFKKHFYHELMDINFAHAIMLTEEGIISEAEAQKIIRGLQEIDQEIKLQELVYTGEFEDVFFYIEQELSRKIGVETAGKLHTGRSRNDIDLTMYKIKLKKYLQDFLASLIELTASLLQVARENQATVVVAYTHGQPAQPTTYGHYLGAVIEILERDLDRLFHAYSNLDRSSMGAAAITTSGFNLNRQRVAELLGFEAVQENSYGSIAAVDYLLELYSSLKILFINLGRFIQDLAQWTSFDLAYLYVPNEFVQISSIMPQKRNPVPLEHLRILSSLAIGHCDTVINSMHNTPFTDMNDAEDPAQVVGFEAFEKGQRVLQLLKALVQGLKVNEDRVKAKIEQSFVTITELADTLVRKEGISFRQAHTITHKIVKKLLENDQELGDFDYNYFRQIFQQLIKREAEISLEELKASLDPEHFIKIRNVFGGPGPQALKNSLMGYQEKLNSYQEELARIVNKTEQAKAVLEEAIRSFLE